MSNNISDFAVQPINSTVLTGNAPTLKKPPYLISLDKTSASSGKALQPEKFISFDKPNVVNGLLEVKGIFCQKSEEEIIKSFADILTNTSKDLILEMMFPIHRIVHIRSLIFNANKGVSK